MTHQIRRDWLNDLPPGRRSSLVPVPYGLYWNRQNLRDLEGRPQTNNLGYRQGAKDTEVPKPPDTFRILVLGSSTTFSDAGAALPEEAWPARLETKLFELPNGFGSLEVINAGLNYALSTELLIHLMLVGLAVEPDMVIWEGPGNDWLPIAVGDDTSDYRKTRAAGEYPRPRLGEKSLMKGSYTARIILSLWLRATPSTGLISLEPADVDWSNGELLERMLSDSFNNFRHNMQIVADICSARSLPLLLVPFTTGSIESQMRTGARPREFLEVQKITNRRLNDLMSAVAEDNGANVSYLPPSIIIPDDHYLDGTHLLPEGEDLKAAWVAAGVRKVLRDRNS